MSTAASRGTLHIYTARKRAIAPSGGHISVISRASDCQFGGSCEPSDFCNRLLGIAVPFASCEGSPHDGIKFFVRFVITSRRCPLVYLLCASH